MESVINLALNYEGPILVNFEVETDKCFPLVAPGKGLDEMFLHEKEVDKSDLNNQLPPG